MQTLILNHYPQVIKQIKEMQQIAKAEDIEFRKLDRSIDGVIQNMFVHTSNESGVRRFEKLVGIKPKIGQDLETRKMHIIFMLNRRKMSLTELMAMISDYTDDAKLVKDTNEMEMAMEIGVGMIGTDVLKYILDEILPLNIYFRFVIKISVNSMEFEKRLPMQIKIALRASFWRTRCFDGSEVMDGSHLMDAMPAYDLRLGIMYGMGKTTVKEQFALAGMSAHLAIPVKENMYMNKQTVSMVVDIWRSLFLDGRALKAMATFGTAAPVQEEFGNATVRVQRHVAYFDGSLLMDGSHLMNSVDREEDI